MICCDRIFRESSVPGNARVCGSGEATTIWSFLGTANQQPASQVAPETIRGFPWYADVPDDLVIWHSWATVHGQALGMIELLVLQDRATFPKASELLFPKDSELLFLKPRSRKDRHPDVLGIATTRSRAAAYEHSCSSLHTPLTLLPYSTPLWNGLEAVWGWSWRLRKNMSASQTLLKR